MYIAINKKDNLSNLIKSFAKFICGEMNITCSIDICLKSKLKKNVTGFVTREVGLYGLRKVTILNGSLKVVMSRIVHELKHIQQLEQNRLIIGDDYIAFNNIISYSKKEYRKVMKCAYSYKLLPWEIEANTEELKIDEYLENFKLLVTNSEDKIIFDLL